jgi:L-seryl-tRNA(Ser) seleniumtransferase
MPPASIIHTNLGRAPLAEARARTAGRGRARLLEPRIRPGEPARRGSRSVHAESLLTALTGAEAAIVVNNNAAAILLILTALAGAARSLISRGELVEIGGGFRVPDVMRQSGAVLREIGTTNRTRVTDYTSACRRPRDVPARAPVELPHRGIHRAAVARGL